MATGHYRQELGGLGAKFWLATLREERDSTPAGVPQPNQFPTAGNRQQLERT